MTIKEQMIRDYIQKIDFHSGDWSVPAMKETMKAFLGEEPAIEVKYKKDVAVNETTGRSYEFLDAEKLAIVFYDTTNTFKKLEFIINDPRV